MSDSYEISGEVKQVLDLQTFASGFTKREFVIETPGEYPQLVRLSCLKDKASLLDPVEAGDIVTATFDVRGNEHNGRVFNDLVCWKLSVDVEGSVVAPPAAAPEPADAAAETDDDDLPF